MSLINDMLRDLDKRKRQSPQVARINTVLGGSAQAPVRAGNRMPLVMLAFISVTIGLGGGYLLFTELQSRRAVLDVAAPATVPSADVAASVPAPVPAPSVSDPNVTVPTADNSPETTPAAPSTNVLDIVQESSTDLGFSLRIRATRSVQYAITSRDTYGITLRLSDITDYSRGSTALNGMSVLLQSGAAEVDFDLDLATDFLVFEDVNTPEFDIVLTANYRVMTPAVSVDPSLSATEQQAPVELAIQPPVQMPSAPAVTVPASQRSTPVRVAREQSLDERDRSISNAAINKARSGQLFEAYQSLLTFVGENPEAHLARETLATLLLAQQDMAQAEAVVDQGLQLAPNRASYKKIKARILMQANRGADALALLSAVPPALADDNEYHELLATLLQQEGQAAKAIALYQELIRSNPEVARWWTGMAIALEAQGNKSQAITAYQAALQKSDLDLNLRQFSQNRIRALSATP